jgi:hypothetical protein
MSLAFCLHVGGAQGYSRQSLKERDLNLGRTIIGGVKMPREKFLKGLQHRQPGAEAGGFWTEFRWKFRGSVESGSPS